jgi:hypothetical protein
MALGCTQHRVVTDENVTNEEFLQLYFELELHQHGPENSNIIKFYPVAGPADGNALLFIIQRIGDSSIPKDSPGLHSIIRLTADTLLTRFETCFLKLPSLRKRWPLNNPKMNLIVRYVSGDYARDRHTLAVTINGETSFLPQDIKRAEERVKKMGGIW